MKQKNELRIAVASTQTEKEQLISLRTRVYRQAGKHSSPHTMTDIFDEKALIVGVWKDDKPIATARVLALAASEEWEHDRFIKWDDSLPNREETAEISRFCIDYRERSYATTKALCSGIAATVASTKRKYFLACCTDELVSFYKNFFGANFLGRSIIHSDLGPKEHHLFICDYHLAMVGSNMKFSIWVSLWAKSAQRCLSEGTLLYWMPEWQRKLFLIKCVLCSFAEPVADNFVDVLRRRKIRRSKKVGINVLKAKA